MVSRGCMRNWGHKSKKDRTSAATKLALQWCLHVKAARVLCVQFSGNEEAHRGKLWSKCSGLQKRYGHFRLEWSDKRYWRWFRANIIMKRRGKANEPPIALKGDRLWLFPKVRRTLKIHHDKERDRAEAWGKVPEQESMSCRIRSCVRPQQAGRSRLSEQRDRSWLTGPRWTGTRYLNEQSLLSTTDPCYTKGRVFSDI